MLATRFFTAANASGVGYEADQMEESTPAGMTMLILIPRGESSEANTRLIAFNPPFPSRLYCTLHLVLIDGPKLCMIASSLQ